MLFPARLPVPPGALAGHRKGLCSSRGQAKRPAQSTPAPRQGTSRHSDALGELSSSSPPVNLITLRFLELGDPGMARFKRLQLSAFSRFAGLGLFVLAQRGWGLPCCSGSCLPGRAAWASLSLSGKSSHKELTWLLGFL